MGEGGWAVRAECGVHKGRARKNYLKTWGNRTSSEREEKLRAKILLQKMKHESLKEIKLKTKKTFNILKAIKNKKGGTHTNTETLHKLWGKR